MFINKDTFRKSKPSHPFLTHSAKVFTITSKPQEKEKDGEEAC